MLLGDIAALPAVDASSLARKQIELGQRHKWRARTRDGLTETGSRRRKSGRFAGRVFRFFSDFAPILHLTHPARTNRRNDFVRTDMNAGRQAHCFSPAVQLSAFISVIPISDQISSLYRRGSGVTGCAAWAITKRPMASPAARASRTAVR